MKKLNLKRVIITLVVCVVVICGVGATFAKMTDKNDAKNKTSVSKQQENKKEEKKEKKVVNYVGTNEEGLKYTYDAKKVAEKLNKYDYKNDGKKIVFLTFDDGTSLTNTPQILKILDKYHVKATFMITGSNTQNGGEKAKELLKQEFNSGHAIGNHSFTHDFHKIYPNRYLDLAAFKEDFNKNDEFLKSVLGKNFSTRVIRCPGGYGSWKGMKELDPYLKEKGFVSIDWSSLSGDAEGGRKSAAQLANYAIQTSKGKEMVVLLMHDTYGKEETVKSLPAIIQYFKDNGYEFRTLR